ncbi:MAG: hypothetical protein JRG89_06510 [Deltaproteobacteria bacterium]|nr:hypothetical protein [Deltaproteobacteria bacterium]
MRPWLALVISLAFAFAYAATRNIYDDEVASFGTTMRPFAEIWRAANAGDIHPPGQYVLSSFFLNLMGSARSMTLGPLVFIYIGLTSFVAALLRNNTLVGSSRTLFAVVAFLHPQILMWGGSIRWQSYWTGLALIVLTLGLSLHREPEDEKLDLPSYPVLLTTGLLLAALLYINYLSFVLIGAFALAWAIRYPMSPASWARLAFTLAIAGLLFIPQIRPLVDVHMASAARQTPSGIGVFLKLLPGALVGQALMPWHPVAPLFGLTTLPFFFVLLGRARRHFFGHSLRPHYPPILLRPARPRAPALLRPLWRGASDTLAEPDLAGTALHVSGRFRHGAGDGAGRKASQFRDLVSDLCLFAGGRMAVDIEPSATQCRDRGRGAVDRVQWIQPARQARHDEGRRQRSLR